MIHYTSRLGIHASGYIFSKMGLVFREQPIVDFGIDAIIETKNDEYLSGKMIAAQIKTGDSYFSESKDGYIVFRGDAKHCNYWINHSLPVIIILYSPTTGKLIWERFNKQTAIKCKKGWKINIPCDQYLEKSKDQLLDLANQQSEFERRWNTLVIAKKWMLETIKQGNLILEVEEWVNKSSGRGRFKLITKEANEKEKVIFDRELFGFGCRNYEQVIQEMFPWADVIVDEDYYEENMDEECRYRKKYNDTSLNIYPYANGAGEVDFYRLKLTLNRVGKSFVEMDNFLETGKFYLLDNITI